MAFLGTICVRGTRACRTKVRVRTAYMRDKKFEKQRPIATLERVVKPRSFIPLSILDAMGYRRGNLRELIYLTQSLTYSLPVSVS